MSETPLISTTTLCIQYDIDISFVELLDTMGLLQIHIVEEQPYVHEEQISHLEMILRLHHELRVNLEGVDIVFHLLQRERDLRKEMNVLKSRLSIYEDQ